jgi:hypothetical protein
VQSSLYPNPSGDFIQISQMFGSSPAMQEVTMLDEIPFTPYVDRLLPKQKFL